MKKEKETNPKNSLISIIVPVYKVEQYLPRCIDSILAQIYTNFELILVDDGSPDNCPQICDDYAQKDKRIKVIHKENGGVSSARNMGIDNAKGDFICFVDSDDWIREDYLQKLYDAIENTDISICDYYVAYSEEKYKELHSVSKARIINKDFGAYFDSSASHRAIWGTLYKKDVIKDIYFREDLKIAEDFLFQIQSIKKAKNINYVDDCLYYYFMNENSVMGNKNNLENRYRNEIEGLLACKTEFENDEHMVSICNFHIYTLSCLAFLDGLKGFINKYKVFNNKNNYENYLKNIQVKIGKIKAFLCRHKMFGLLKLLYKFKKK